MAFEVIVTGGILIQSASAIDKSEWSLHVVASGAATKRDTILPLRTDVDYISRTIR